MKFHSIQIAVLDSCKNRNQIQISISCLYGTTQKNHCTKKIFPNLIRHWTIFNKCQRMISNGLMHLSVIIRMVLHNALHTAFHRFPQSLLNSKGPKPSLCVWCALQRWLKVWHAVNSFVESHQQCPHLDRSNMFFPYYPLLLSSGK